MKQKFLTYSMKSILEYHQDFTEEEIEKLKYGLEGVYLTLTKTIILLAIAFLFGILKETLILVLLFNIIRYPAFGFHADSSKTCLIFSSILFLGIPYLFLNYELSKSLEILIISFTLLSFILYAPSDTVKRPLINPKKRLIRKISACILAILYIIGYYLIPNLVIARLLLASVVLETIMILPITYKIFKQPYRNYATYQI